MLIFTMVWSSSDLLFRTKALKDTRDFTIQVELTKPSQSVYIYLSSVGAMAPFGSVRL
jgi:hypothetical protein